MKHHPQFEDIHNKIIQQVTGNMRYYGYQGTIGHVMAVVYYSNGPMSLDDLAEKTGMSKTRMSQVMREMMQLNIAQKVFIKGSRKDFYKIESDYYKVFISFITSNLRELAIRNKRLDQEIIDDLHAVLKNEDADEEEKSVAEAYLQDAEGSVEYFQWIENLVVFLESGEVFKHVHKDVGKKDFN